MLSNVNSLIVNSLFYKLKAKLKASLLVAPAGLVLEEIKTGLGMVFKQMQTESRGRGKQYQTSV